MQLWSQIRLDFQVKCLFRTKIRHGWVNLVVRLQPERVQCSSSTPTLKVCHASVPSTSARVCLGSHWWETLNPPAGFWGSHQDEGAVPWRDLCPLTSSTRTTTACSRWSSTWACLWGSTSESLFNPDVSPRLLYPYWSAAVVLWNPIWVTRGLSDEMLHYWPIGWLQSQACTSSLHQQNSPFGGDPIWPLSRAINQVRSLCHT